MIPMIVIVFPVPGGPYINVTPSFFNECSIAFI